MGAKKKKKVYPDRTNVSIRNIVHKQMKDYLQEEGLKMTHFVEKAILNELQKEKSPI